MTELKLRINILILLRVFLVFLVPQEGMVYLDQEVYLECLDPKEILERMVSKEKLVLLVPKVSRVEKER